MTQCLLPVVLIWFNPSYKCVVM